MKLAILSRNNKLYSTQRLVTAARERGHVVRVLDPLRCYMRIAPGQFELNYKGKALTGVDAVIPRIGASVTRYGTAVLRQFEMMGAYTPNSSDAILRARDKLRCHQLLAGEGIGLPTTVFGDNPDDTSDLQAHYRRCPQGRGYLGRRRRHAGCLTPAVQVRAEFPGLGLPVHGRDDPVTDHEAADVGALGLGHEFLHQEIGK